MDLDAFYASVEALDDPSLTGKAFGVGHGVLTTASYEARKFGVRSGMASTQRITSLHHTLFIHCLFYFFTPCSFHRAQTMSTSHYRQQSLPSLHGEGETAVFQKRRRLESCSLIRAESRSKSWKCCANTMKAYALWVSVLRVIAQTYLTAPLQARMKHI